MLFLIVFSYYSMSMPSRFIIDKHNTSMLLEVEHFLYSILCFYKSNQ